MQRLINIQLDKAMEQVHPASLLYGALTKQSQGVTHKYHDDIYGSSVFPK